MKESNEQVMKHTHPQILKLVSGTDVLDRVIMPFENLKKLVKIKKNSTHMDGYI